MARPLSFLLLALSLSPAVHALTVAESVSGLRLSVFPDGTYLVNIQNSNWAFVGTAAGPLQFLQSGNGTDGIGAYDEMTFQFVDSGVPKQGGIRIYQQKPVVLFTLRYVTAGQNGKAFPDLVEYPTGLYHLINKGWQQFFDDTTTTGPLVEFDSNAHTFIISPASNFMVAHTSVGLDGSISSGISTQISNLPSGFTHQTLLVIDQGINRAFETWGHALTDLQGKVRPPNNRDITLSHLGYWTDNGARYYYRFDESLGYDATLDGIRNEFERKGVPLGYMQLDSWFYPKGPTANWLSSKDGIYEYEAAPQLFGKGLKAFQQDLGLPLLTHARWIDQNSPYRHEYQMSNNVSIDPRYWTRIMSYLKDAGVMAYEQDWLALYAKTDFNLTDPNTFLDEMAQAATQYGLTIQYCMPLPEHYLQSSKYNNVTTIRTSADRFGQSRWDPFLYGSRLASAVGLWPWADVFMSSEVDNLLVATLSAGPVGVGDPLGAVDPRTLSHAVRKDGVIVKPDVPLVPADQTILQDAQGLEAPMVAATYTEFPSLKVAYVFAHPRGTGRAISLQPGSLGFSGQVYVYNYLRKAGRAMDASETFSDEIPGAFSYYVVTPIFSSGIGLLGDAGQFATVGRQRITGVTYDGDVHLTVAFAAGEGSREIFGYSAKKPVATAETGAVSPVSFDASTRIFRFHVAARGEGTATVKIMAQ